MLKKSKMKKLVIGVTAPGSIILIEGQLKYFTEQGYKTYLITQEDERVRAFCEKEGCEFLPIIINRDITIMNDFKTLLQIYKHFKRVKPDIVNVGTSKMGFLGTIASFLNRVPLRIYTARGLRFETEKGIKRIVLIGVLKIVGLLTHKIICISDAVRVKGISNGVFPAQKAIVIHKGSSNGINLEKFETNNQLLEKSKILKTELGLDNNIVYGFIGRLNDRKGVNELYNAFDKINSKYINSKLLIVGPAEIANLSDKSIIAKIESQPNIIYVGFQSDIPLYLSLMDIFVLPTWSEGFGNVFIQAAAMKVPVIGTKALGVQNAVADGFNGILVEIKNEVELVQAMEKLYNNKELREKLSKNGFIWAQNFDRKIIWQGQQQIYEANQN